jgi:hypothetical protein
MSIAKFGVELHNPLEDWKEVHQASSFQSSLTITRRSVLDGYSVLGTVSPEWVFKWKNR